MFNCYVSANNDALGPAPVGWRGFIFLFSLLCICVPLKGDTIEIKSRDGATIKGELLALEYNGVKFQRVDGQVFRIPWEKLAESEKARLTEMLKPTEEEESLEIPGPIKGRVYEISDLRTEKADLAGQVVRVELETNWLSDPEQQDDGTFHVFVGSAATGRDNYAIVVFPREAKRMIDVMNNSRRGKMSFYAMVTTGNPWLYAVGRTYRPIDGSNLRFEYFW